MKRVVLKKAYGADDLDSVAKAIVDLLPEAPIWLLYGTLGAGKTTLVGSILRQKGVRALVTSPTFSYVNSYKNEKGETFYHFDLYRIASQEGFFSAGFDEYLYRPKSWVFIEWPEQLISALSGSVGHIFIEYCGDEKREILVEISSSF